LVRITGGARSTSPYSEQTFSSAVLGEGHAASDGLQACAGLEEHDAVASVEVGADLQPSDAAGEEVEADGLADSSILGCDLRDVELRHAVFGQQRRMRRGEVLKQLAVPQVSEQACAFDHRRRKRVLAAPSHRSGSVSD